MKTNEPRKQARQSRAIATHTAILEAAAHILEEKGAGALTTNATAERAGVSIGSLYQYFPNKQAIVATLLRQEWAAMLAKIQMISNEEASPEQKLRRLIDVAIGHQFARPRLALELEHIEGSLGLSAEMQALAAAIAAEILVVVQNFDPAADTTIAADIVSICRVLTNDAAQRSETDVKAMTKRINRAVFGFLSYPS